MASTASEVLDLEPSLRVVISEQLAVRIEQDTVMTLAEGDPNRQVGGLQAGAGLFARFSVALVHQKSYLAPCQDSPLRHSVCVFVPNVQHPVVKVGGSTACQREDHHAYGALLWTAAQHRAPWIFQVNFHFGETSGEYSAVQQQRSTWTTLVLKLWDGSLSYCIREIRYV